MEDLVESDFDFNTATTLYKNGDKVTILLARANNGKQYVVKRLKVSSIGEANTLLKESYAMMGLNHENIIKIHAGLLGGSGGSFEYFLFVMDYYPDGDLDIEIKLRGQRRNFWSQTDLLQIFKGMASGFGYMQNIAIAHRDIKPQNILRDVNKFIISDLGYAFKTRDGKSFHIAGTRNYLSPLLRYAYSAHSQGADLSGFDQNVYKSNVFSLGLTFLYMASLQSIDELGTLNQAEFENVLRRRVEGLAYDMNVKTIIYQMLEFEEAKRWDFNDLCGFLGSQVSGVTIQEKFAMPTVGQPRLPYRGNADTRASWVNSTSERSLNYKPPKMPQIPTPSNHLAQHRIRLSSQPLRGFPQSSGNINNSHMAPGITSPKGAMTQRHLPRLVENNAIAIEETRKVMQHHTGNLGISQILQNQKKNYYKWRVKTKEGINLKEFTTKIVNSLLWSENSEIYHSLCRLSNLSGVTVLFKKMNYKCKICNNYIDPQSSLHMQCAGYAHTECILQYSTYTMSENIIYYGFMCNFCEQYHCINQKILTQCTSCYIPTIPKENIGEAWCLNCISQDRNTKGANNVLLAYKAIAKISNECYKQLNGLCSICRSIPDVFLIGKHWCCYNCIFTHMNFEDCIQCPSGCCYSQKVNMPPVEFNISNYPSTDRSSNNKTPFMGFEEREQISCRPKTNPLIKSMPLPTSAKNERPIPSHLAGINIMT